MNSLDYYQNSCYDEALFVKREAWMQGLSFKVGLSPQTLPNIVFPLINTGPQISTSPPISAATINVVPVRIVTIFH